MKKDSTRGFIVIKKIKSTKQTGEKYMDEKQFLDRFEEAFTLVATGREQPNDPNFLRKQFPGCIE